MMKKLLPADFTYEKYGVKARLVTEADAEFITALRSDAKLGRYLHASDGDVLKQIEWIREYKKREAEGEEYYLIYSADGCDFGVNRIYDINWFRLSYTSGSWVCRPDTDMRCSMVLPLFCAEIAFDILGLRINLFEVMRGNKQVLTFHRKYMCSIQYGETEDYFLFYATPETSMNNKITKFLL